MAQRSGKPSERDQKNLKVFLQKYFGGPHWGSDKSISYSAAFVDLKGDGSHEVVVYVEGNGMCGSGGCVTMILEPTGSSYKQIGYVTISRPPIRVLASKTNGWNDIGVLVVGGGILIGYEAKLSFNGRKYPGNPSIAPAQRLSQKVAGEAIITSGSQGIRLYH
jgi:hypothetical protein